MTRLADGTNEDDLNLPPCSIEDQMCGIVGSKCAKQPPLHVNFEIVIEGTNLDMGDME
jgi:hypothetical protein